MLVSRLRTVRNVLILSVYFLSICLVGVKSRIFFIKRDIKSVDAAIARLENEKKELKIEWSYLTNSDNLKVLYARTQRLMGEKKDVVAVSKIRDVNNLMPYYLGKIDDAKTVAVK